MRLSSSLAVVAIAALFSVVGCSRNSSAPTAATQAGTQPPVPLADSVLYDGKPASEWLKTLDDANPETRTRAAGALAAIAKRGDVQVVPALIRVVGKGGAVDVRSAAVSALAQMRKDGAAAVPELAACLADTDMTYRWLVGGAIRDILRDTPPGADDRLSPAHVTAALKSDETEVKWAGLRLIGRLPAEKAKPFFPTLVKSLTDNPQQTASGERMAATASFVMLGEAGVPAVAVLLKQERTWKVACGTLREVGKPAVRVLGGLVTGPDRDLAMAVVKALGEFGEAAEEAIPVLVRSYTGRYVVRGRTFTLIDEPSSYLDDPNSDERSPAEVAIAVETHDVIGNLTSACANRWPNKDEVIAGIGAEMHKKDGDRAAIILARREVLLNEGVVRVKEVFRLPKDSRGEVTIPPGERAAIADGSPEVRFLLCMSFISRYAGNQGPANADDYRLVIRASRNVAEVKRDVLEKGQADLLARFNLRVEGRGPTSKLVPREGLSAKDLEGARQEIESVRAFIDGKNTSTKYNPGWLQVLGNQEP